MRLLLAILLLLIAAPAWAQQGQGMSQAMVVSSCGGGAATSGPLNQLTMDPQGRLCQSGIGSNVCSQATAYLARTAGGNEGGNAVNITALICGLVTDGIIDGTLAGTTTCGSHLDGLYVLAQQNEADALLNLCGTSYNLTRSGDTSTFTAYRGFQGFTTGLITGFNPGTAGSKFAQNSGNIGVWSNAVTADNAQQILSSSTIHIYDNFAGTFYARVNDAAGGVATPGTKGLFVGDRADVTGTHPFWDGIDQGLQAVASSAVSSNVMIIGGSATTQQLSEGHFGGSLGATLNLALYNRLRTYMTAVGVP